MYMGSTSSSVNQKTHYIGYLCSNCRNPVIDIITIQFKAPVRTDKSGNVTEEYRQKAASALEKAEKELFSYFQNPTGDTYPRNASDNVSCHGWNVPCPVCENVESWQDRSLLRTQSVLSEITVFPNLESAYEWARAILVCRKSEADSVLSSTEELKHLLSTKEEVNAAQSSIRAELENGEAVQRVAELQKKKEQISSELKAQGIFSKERKRIQAELISCEEEIQSAEGRLANEKKRLEHELAKSEIQAKDCQLLQRHYANGGFLMRAEEALALRLQENDDTDDSGCAISLQPLPELASAMISTFEKNKDFISKVLALGILQKLTNSTTSQLEEDRK